MIEGLILLDNLLLNSIRYLHHPVEFISLGKGIADRSLSGINWNGSDKG
jgi:hypothetical protein